MPFSFLNPWLAAGALAVAAPIIIHFLFRRRAKPLEFSAMRYVLLSYKKVARRLILEEYLLLATRCLMALLLPLALAVPLVALAPSGLSRGAKPLEAVFVIDTSLSMTRMDGGKDLLAKGRGLAGEWIKRLTVDDRVGFVDAARLTGEAPGKDLEAMAEKIAALKPAARVARMPEALALAASYFSGLAERDRAIVILTDLQRASFTQGARAAADLPPVFIVDLAQDLKPRNLAFAPLEIKWKSMAREEAVELKATVNNFGAEDVSRSMVSVEIGGQAVANGFVDVPAGKSAEKTFNLTEVPEGSGALKIEAEDGLVLDNTQYFQLRGGQEVRALIVDGDPGATWMESETYFLEHALDPRLYARSRISPLTITASGLGQQDLAGFKVLILANVETPKPPAAAKIIKFVSNGGGLLVTLGDKVDADSYNAVFRELLPRELRGVHQPYAGAQGSTEVRVMHLETPGEGAREHPLLGVFASPAQGDLGLADFRKYFLMQQEVNGGAKVILRLTDGAPMMAESEYGAGKVIVFASTVDRAWNNLCIHPTFLPLFQQTVQYLGNALVREDEGRLTVGSVIEMPVSADVTGARVLLPSGATEKAELFARDRGPVIRFTATGEPGVYWFKYIRPRSPDPGRFAPREADRALVLNIDPGESDLARIEANEIQALTGATNIKVIGPGDSFNSGDAAPPVKKPYALELLYALAALAILERGLTRKS